MQRKAILLTLAVGALLSQTAIAETNLGLKGIGGAIGVVNPEDMDATFGLGLMVDHGTIVPHLALESRLDWWSKSQDAYGSEVSARDIAVGARCRYLFDLSTPTIKPFVGTGLGLHFLHAEVNMVPPPGFPGQPVNVEDSSTKLGLDLGGGMMAAVGPRTALLAELWYGVVSDFSQLSFRVGMAYKFGPPMLESRNAPVRNQPSTAAPSKSAPSSKATSPKSTKSTPSKATSPTRR
jgi:hypothetical protein